MFHLVTAWFFCSIEGVGTVLRLGVYALILLCDSMKQNTPPPSLWLERPFGAEAVESAPVSDPLEIATKEGPDFLELTVHLDPLLCRKDRLPIRATSVGHGLEEPSGLRIGDGLRNADRQAIGVLLLPSSFMNWFPLM